jgi:hypothetical protein
MVRVYGSSQPYKPVSCACLQETPDSLLPPAAFDLGHQVIETQQYAIAQPGEDSML